MHSLPNPFVATSTLLYSLLVHMKSFISHLLIPLHMSPVASICEHSIIAEFLRQKSPSVVKELESFCVDNCKRLQWLTSIAFVRKDGGLADQ